MNNNERITQLESMLSEERWRVSKVLGVMESYARGLDMMARTSYAEAPAGSRDEKNASALQRHTADMVGWLAAKSEELHELMERAMPSGHEEAPSPPADDDDMSALPFIREDGLADPSVPAENIEQSPAVTIH